MSEITSSQLIIVASILGMMGWMGATIFYWTFCVRRMPRWMFLLLGIANTAMYMRFIATQTGVYPLDNKSALIYVATGLAAFILMIVHARFGLKDGDRCPHKG